MLNSTNQENMNQNYVSYYLTATKVATINKQKRTRVGWDVGKLGRLSTVGRSVIGAAQRETGWGSSEVTDRTIVGPSRAPLHACTGTESRVSNGSAQPRS